MNGAVVLVAVLGFVVLCMAWATQPCEVHCGAGWERPAPGYTVPERVDPHGLWRDHIGCDVTACEWKAAAVAALWSQGRMRPDPRIEHHLRGHP